MDGLSPFSPIALLGSVLAHAAFGVAVVGFGQGTAPAELPKKPAEMVFFDIAAPVQPEPVVAPVVEEPVAVHRVRPAAAVVREVEPPAPSPVTEPAPSTPAATPVPELVAAEVVEAPAVGLAADTLTGVEAKGFSAGSSVVGAKTGNGTVPVGSVVAATRGVVQPATDRSRAAGLADGRNWDCSFPVAAEDEGIDNAQVTLQVEIGADGAMLKTTVVRDPGFGFGHEARRCAMRRRWSSRLDRAGTPVAGRATVVVHFVR